MKARLAVVAVASAVVSITGLVAIRTSRPEIARGAPKVRDAVIAPVPLVLAATTTTAAPKRVVIPLPEAKQKGLWGRPDFEGCTGYPGGRKDAKPVPSPPWLGALFAQSSWPKVAWPKLCRVIGCESGFRPDARGGLGNRMLGLTQIDEKSWLLRWRSLGFTDMFDPLQNLEFAFWLYTTTRDSEDWNVWPGDQWTCNRA
jgi:hypothetical protein